MEYLVKFNSNDTYMMDIVFASTSDNAVKVIKQMYDDVKEIKNVYMLTEKNYERTHECNEMHVCFKIGIKLNRWSLIGKDTGSFHSITYCPFCGEKL